MQSLQGERRTCARRLWVSVALLLSGTLPAHASFLSGETLDTAADWLSVIVLILVPGVAIALFWMVHVLPEKIAEKRHHPQKEAIHTLCLLSLVFGGMLWPAAWLWAYSRPVVYRIAHGTERHEDYFHEQAELAERGEIDETKVEALRKELDEMARHGPLSPSLRALKDRLDARAGLPPAADGTS
jgi:CBS domain containing-hemolysin-like protein